MRRNALALVLLLLVACGGEPTTPVPDLTAVPDPDLSGMEPQVAELLDRGREQLLAEQDSAEAWGNLGALYDAHGRPELAESCYGRAIELAPEDFRWNYLLAIVREMNGAESAEVTRLFERAGALRPDYAQIYLRMGDAFSRRGDYEPARRGFERVVELAPQSAAAHRGLGQVLLSLGEAAAAIEALNQALVLEPSDRAVYSALSQAHMRSGDTESAQKYVVLAENLEPVNVIDDPVWGTLVYERSVSSSRAFRRGRSKLTAEDHAGAAADFEIVLKARPDDPSTHFWLGTAYRELGESDRALAHFLRAAELKDTMAKAHTEASELLFAAGRHDEAAEHLQAALKVRPNDPALYLALAEVLMRRGDLEGLVTAYRKAGELGPLGARESANLGVALMRLGKAAEAVEHYRASLALRPDNPNTLYNLGLAHEMLDQTDAAVRRFEEAAELDPSHPAARHLAESHADRH